MTDDELLHALRNSKGWKTLGKAAADRIEELEKERDEALNQLDSARHSIAVLEKRVKTFSEGWGVADKGRLEAEAYAAELEAKLSKSEALLAKAVEALGEIAKPKVGPDLYWSDDEVARWRAGWYRKYGDIARTTLAELKGEKDD